MERYEGLRKIDSYDEAREARKRFENYMKLYKWILETDSPYEDIKDALYKCIEKRKLYEEKDSSESDEKKDEEAKVSRCDILENEGEILSLKLQYEAIKNGTFAATLRRNITALYLSIGDWEARHQPIRILSLKKRNEDKEEVESEKNPLYTSRLMGRLRSFLANVKGVVIGEEDEREEDPLYTSRSMRRLRFFLANVTGLVPGEVDINMEGRKGIPLYIIENYDLVNKPEVTEQQKENALIAIPQVDHSFDFYKRMFDIPVAQMISMYGIKEKFQDEIVKEISDGKTNGDLQQSNSKEVMNQPTVHENGSKDSKTNKGKDTNERTH